MRAGRNARAREGRRDTMDGTGPGDVAERLARVNALVETARRGAGAARTVRLVAVSKRQSDARIDAALAAGHRVFGENRVQEAQERWGRRRETHDDIALHLVGPLQSNKAGDAVAMFDVIEVLDREKLAREIAAQMRAQGRRPACLVQVNTGEEAQKSGVMPSDADDFIVFCRDECGIDVTGLMCIPPIDEEPAMHFALLSTIAARNGLAELSMGMSGDFEQAIALGATSVRVGTAIFGERET